MLPSHNCIIITMFSFQGASLNLLRDSMKLQPPVFRLPLKFQSISFLEVVGQNGLEPSTSRLSVVCSSQLSYWPISRRNQIHNLRIYLFKLNARLCLCFSSQIKTRFAALLICLDMTFRSGGPKWTRTIDLTIISRVL